jgi:hypothetical protein
LTCTKSACTFSFDTILVHYGGELLIDDRVASTTIYVRLFVVDGKLIAGTKDKPFTSHFEIVLTGKSKDQDDPNIPKLVLGHGAGSVPYSKVLLARFGSLISLHGLPKSSWIKIQRTVAAGSSTIELTDAPAGWKAGDRLVVPSTGMMKSRAGSGENEVVTLASVVGPTLKLVERLQFEHFGDSHDVRLRGEVGALSHNIVIRGDNTDKEHEACTQAMFIGFGKDNLPNVREQCYGGHTASLHGATVQISSVELTRMGQATRIARYPIHWHLAGDQSEFGSYVMGNSLWENYQRCVTVHGTWGAEVEDNVCYHTYGHAFYLEDAIEHNNRFVHNLVVGVRRGPMVCSDMQVGPSAFWITNPNNTFIDNVAVDIGDTSSGMGYWIISGGEIQKETGPSYTGTNYWTYDFQNKVAGLVFNPSRSVFGPTLNLSRTEPLQRRLSNIYVGAPSWMLGQQQGRTPLKEFRGNGVRSSFRGVHVDGFVTSSVPGEIGDDMHDPEDLTAFGIKDGTCNYFPAGHYAVPSAEGIHVYVPTHFTYNANGQAENFSPAYSIIDGLHVSRCFDTWWSRASRINITNSVFAYNWVGMTNHIPGENFCPGTGIASNPGLANHVVNSLYIGHGDATINNMLCRSAGLGATSADESPAGIRQYDGAFWLSDVRWVNMSTVTCPAVNDDANDIATLPYALVAGRQDDCNGKFPIRLYNSWPLGASPEDATGKWSWALGAKQHQNLAQFTGTASCGRGPSGGVVDMTGTLDPLHPSLPTAYFAESGSPANPGELAKKSEAELQTLAYKQLPATSSAHVTSFAWATTLQEKPDFAHICGYCFYDESGNCPNAPKVDIVV